MATARDCIKRIIIENIGDRKLVSIGKFVKLDDFLRENGLGPIYYSSLDEDKSPIADGFISIKEIKGKRNEYFILVPFEMNDSLKELLGEYGYENIHDYVSMQIMHKQVSNVTNYVDAFGNRCNYVPDSVDIMFKGINARIEISPMVKTLEKIKIEVDTNAQIFIDENAVLTGSLLVSENGILKIGERASCKWECVDVGNDCEVIIGNDTTFTSSGEIICTNGKVIIGQDCMIAAKSLFWCGDGHAIYNVKTRTRTNASDIRNSIILGDHVWIGTRCIVLSYTNIADGSIVGAGSVVKGTFPNNCVIAGNPCSLKREDAFWCRDLYGEIKESEWQYFNETQK